MRRRDVRGWLLASLAVAACSAPPWQIGATLTGAPSIPPASAHPSPDEARRTVALERQAGHAALELRALAGLEADFRLNAMLRARLSPGERARLADLLVARAAAFHELGRAAPESRDLEAVARLDPARGARLAHERAAAAIAAGDAWKAIGARADAEAAFALGAGLGGVDPKAPTSPTLPTSPTSPKLPLAPAAAPPAALTALPPDLENWVLEGPALSARILPLSAAFPAVLDDATRAAHWADLLLDEDPSSPDVLELAAYAFGRAGRFGGTERMLMELAFHTPDRAAGLARGAAVWERLGRPREACAQWIRAARWRDQPEDPLWRKAISCARRDPGAGDWRAIRTYVLDRAPPERRQALAATLDGPDPE